MKTKREINHIYTAGILIKLESNLFIQNIMQLMKENILYLL